MRNSNYITISAVLTICEGLLTTVSTQILVTDARGHADLRKKSPGRTVLRENNFRIGYNFNNLNTSKSNNWREHQINENISKKNVEKHPTTEWSSSRSPTAFLQKNKSKLRQVQGKLRKSQDTKAKTFSYSSMTFRNKTDRRKRQREHIRQNSGNAEDSTKLFRLNQYFGNEERIQESTRDSEYPRALENTFKYSKKLFSSAEDKFKVSPIYDFSLKNNFSSSTNPSLKTKFKKFNTDLKVKNIVINTKSNKFDFRPFFHVSDDQVVASKHQIESYLNHRESFRTPDSKFERINDGQLKHQEWITKETENELVLQRQILERRKRKLLQEEKVASELARLHSSNRHKQKVRIVRKNI